MNLRDKILASNSDNPRDFTAVLNQGMKDLGLSYADISERFDASIPSVRRWSEGSSKPSRAVRLLIFQYLRRMIRA